MRRSLCGMVAVFVSQFSGLIHPLVAAERKPAFEVAAQWIRSDGTVTPIVLLAATQASIRYRRPGGTKDVLDLVIAKGDSIYTEEPVEFSMAMELFQARRYAEAKVKMIAVKVVFESVAALPDSYATLAAFYELECLRKLVDLEGLAYALQRFPKGVLTRGHQLRQLELYVFWDAMRTKSWERLDTLAQGWKKSELPGEQRAQVEYCHGAALEALGRPNDALMAYHTAVTADAGTSEVITRLAALRILSIHLADPEVQTAILQIAGKSPISGTGNGKLDEAIAMARLYEMSLGADMPLPIEFRPFLVLTKK